MTDKRNLIRRTAALATSLVFMLSGTTSGYVTAEDSAANEQTEAITLPVTESFTEPVTESPKTEPAVSETENMNTEENQNKPDLKSVRLYFNITGDSIPHYYSIVNALFKTISVKNIGDTWVDVAYDDDSIENLMWAKTAYDKGETVTAEYSDVKYRLDSIYESGDFCFINLTEIYSLSYLKNLNATVEPADENIRDNMFFPTGTVMAAYPPEGWKTDEPCIFTLQGKVETSVVSDASGDRFIVKSGGAVSEFPVEKTGYRIVYQMNHDVNIRINGKEGKEYNGFWVDSDTVEIEVSPSDKSGIKVTDISLLEMNTGKRFPLSSSGDGKTMKTSVDAKILSSDYRDGENYRLLVGTLSDKIGIDTYISNGDEDVFYKNIEFSTAVSDHNAFIEVSPIIYENGVARYIITSVQYDGKEKEYISDEELLKSNQLINDFVFKKDEKMKVYYREVELDSDLNYSLIDGLKIKSNLISKKLMLVNNLISLNSCDGTAFVIYDSLDKNGKIESFVIPSASLFTYYADDNLINAINIKSILYYENDEFHNMLQEPLYFYFDNHAPEMFLTDMNNKSLDDARWENTSYGFKIHCNDAEEFSESSEAGNDANEIRRNINGAYSEITQMKAGDCVLQKESGKWVIKDAPADAQYSVEAEDISDTEFEVTLEIKSGLNILEKNIEVTVSDSCGNTSAPQIINLKMEREDPVVSSMKIEGLSFYNDPVYGKCAGAGMDIRQSPEKLYCEFEIEENISGLKQIALWYINQDKGDLAASHFRLYEINELRENAEYSFRQEGGHYYFRVPLPADRNARVRVMAIVRDNADNGVTVYLNEGEPAVKENDGAVLVMDGGKPEASISAVTFPDYTDGENNLWYGRIPDFKVRVSDSKDTVNSGVRFVRFTVNGVTVQSEDILGMGEPDFTVSGVHSEKDPDKADVYYECEGTRVKIASVDLGSTGGRLEVSAESVDAAGNHSETADYVVYVDANPPVSSPEFSIENGESSIRAYGTFLNRSAKLRVSVYEPEGRPASGLRDAVLWFDGRKYACKFSGEKNTVAEFGISFDGTVLSGAAEIVLTDNTGNTFRSDELLNSKGSSLIVFESSPPEITDEETESAVKYTDSEGTAWYSEDVSLSLAVSEPDDVFSGIRNTEIFINGKEIVNENFRDGKEILKEKTWKFSTSQSDFPDGKYDIILRTSDNADNPAEFRKTIAVDRTAPEITGMGIDGEDVPMSIFDGAFVLPFAHFFRNETVLTVYAADRNASSGMKKIVLDLYNFRGEITDSFTASGADIKQENDLYRADFRIAEGFKGYIVAHAADNTENESDKFTAEGFITESEARHSETASAVISLPETEFSDRNGVALYGGDISAVISAEDSFSGIGGLQWNATEYGENRWRSIRAEKDGRLSGENAGDFEIKSSENNLITALTGRALLTQDRNSGLLKIKMTDNAGNTSEDVRNYSIDKKAPVISVTYDDAKSDAASGIFSDQRTANISVNERNFDPGRISVTVDGNNGGVSFGSWSLVSGAEGSDSAVYSMPVTFSGNGEYVLRAEGTDMCNNQADKFESEKFIIDRTAPELEVISSGAELKNGFCWNGARTVTIRITEHNFDASRIHISGTADGEAEGFPEIPAFVNSGDLHTAVIVFSENADYTLRIEGEDAAGNAMKSYSENFTVDSEKPEIKFEGVMNKSANKGDISLRVFIKDKNADEDMIDINVTGANRGDISDSAGIMEQTDEGWLFTFGEFKKDRETDDIYTVNVSAGDMAENSSEAALTFSVNRFGSTYVFDESSLEIADRYIKKPVDIVLHEINVDELNMARTTVRIARDNNIVELERDRDYTIELNGGDGSWCDYRYEIKASNFKDDAAYRIQVSSVDAAGNKNANSIDEKKAEFKFGVDRTPPKCIPVNIDKNGSYKADSMDIEFICEDNILVSAVDVFVDGYEMNEQLSNEGSRYRFTLLSSDAARDIKIVLTDAAGNQNTTLLQNVLISSSLIKVLVHNTMFWVTLFFLTAAGVAVYVWKKRKDDNWMAEMMKRE